jgi:peptidoglycan/LPS O-acetylase OafA/YrhL
VQPIRALTSIRGIAAWWVVIYHFRDALPQGVPAAFVSFAASGYMAVDLFFELSGFVIALNYFGHFETYAPRRHLGFLGLRIARIYPLHAFMLLLFLLNPLSLKLFSTSGTIGDQYGFDYYFLSVVLMQNWGITRDLGWNVPAWSISTEWFAYLIFPALVWFFRHSVRDRATTLALLAMLLVVLAGCAHAAGGLGDNIPTFGLLRCLLEFCIGICLYRLQQHRPPHAATSRMSFLLALLCFVGFAVFSLPDYAIMPLGFALLIYALLDENRLPARLLRARVFEWLGLVSYSTYLVHYFAKDWVKFLTPEARLTTGIPFLAYVVAVFVASPLLYYFVEVPGRRTLRALTARLAASFQPGD